MALLNLIWFIFGGEIVALLWLVLAGVFSITVIGIPIGKACLQFAKLSAFPFGKEIISETELKGEDNVSKARKIGGLVLNVVWFPIGLALAVIYVVMAVVSFITIVGIPAGVVQAK
ncbi:MAG: YccF family protein, partial [Treponema sp.]|nr:YccF family protein [Treponema sp.]